MSVGEVATAIQRKNINLSAGELETPQGVIIVRTVEEINSGKEVENIIVRSNDTGQAVRIKDVGNVVMGPMKPEALHRSRRKRAVFLDIRIKQHADILSSVKKIKVDVDKFVNNTEKYQGIKYSKTNDLSYYVDRRLNILKGNGILGMGLVFICLTLFLNMRISLMTSLGAPIAFMVAFMLMDGMDLSINLIFL